MERKPEGHYNLPGKRGIRLDFYVRDINGTVFNVEMQKQNDGNLPKRTRYYSALLDAPLLEKGERQLIKLPNDLYYRDLRFRFVQRRQIPLSFPLHCDEDPGLILQNGLTVVFLNTKEGRSLGRAGIDSVSSLCREQHCRKKHICPKTRVFRRCIERSTLMRTARLWRRTI